jgi:hypothetical protein
VDVRRKTYPQSQRYIENGSAVNPRSRFLLARLFTLEVFSFDSPRFSHLE